MRTRALFALFALSIVLAACARGRLRKEVVIGQETIPVVMPTGEGVTHPDFGKETFLAVGAMAGVKPAKANGVADMHVFEKGATIATVKLNIEEAPAGSHYVAWLKKPGSLEKIRLDKLENPLGDVRHGATATIEKDLHEYLEVVVTLEKNSGPSDSDIPQAQGLLKEQKRR